ncbi:MAG: hypothetical protein HN348_27455, partial [Proteobacteria bacterium]|nr:hypothetical protein [Pseudomonadota bacterium]
MTSLPIRSRRATEAEGPRMNREMEITAKMSLEDFPRLQRLRQALLEARTALGVQRAKLITEYYQKEGMDPQQPVLSQARALAWLLGRLPTPVFDDELIVGSTTEHRLGALLYPEFMGLAIWPELPNLAFRSHDPVSITSEDAELLGNEVFPFWRDMTIHEATRKKGDPMGSIAIGERMVFYLLAKSNGISHIIPDFNVLVQRGLNSIIDEAAQLGAQASDRETREFHAAVQVALSGVVHFAERYATACEVAAHVASARRAAELREIAEILRYVPANKPRNLHEALQAIWVTQVALHQENCDLALSFGRLDQILHPFYEMEFQSRRLSEREAGELIGCFFVKMGDHTPLIPSAAQDLFGGSATNQAVTIGGLLPDGSDGVNCLSLMLMKMAEILALREPNLCARVHGGSSHSYRRALVESIYQTGASPALYNDEPIVEGLVAYGLDAADARDYGVIGCVETTSCGRTMGMTGAILLNLAAVLELTLSDGVHLRSRLRIGPPSGQLGCFNSFEELYRSFEVQLDSLVALANDGNQRLAEAHAAVHPTPLLSALINGTAESGRDVTRGGAKYNSSGVAVVGLADVADSLTALKQGVFEQRR